VSDRSTDDVLSTDFHAQWEQVREAVLSAVERVGESGWLILGREVEAFERELAGVCASSHAVGCASGLDAIEIGLRCLDLAPGERVLTTPLSAFATALAIHRAGGVPAFVDVDASGQLDLEQVARACGADRDLRFCVPVHLYGHALDLATLAELRDRFELRIVEDCAQAIGATSRGTPVGSVGAVAATSFYPTKNLGAMGDGGALWTDSADIAERARCLRDYGQTGKYVHALSGMNSRLDEMQAAILRSALLPELATSTARRREIASRYREQIASATLDVPPVPAGSHSVWHQFPVLVRGDREAFQSHLRSAGIASGIHFPIPIPDQAGLADWGVPEPGPLPVARDFCAREVSLPVHPFLPDAHVERVIAACNAWTG